MRKSIRALVAGTGMAAAVVSGSVAAPATASAAPATVQSPCGEFTSWMGEIWYNHCGPTNVVIYVDRLNIGGIRDYEKCVSPGETRLGPWPDWQGAWYLRPC